MSLATQHDGAPGTLGALAAAIELLATGLCRESFPPTLTQALLVDHDDDGRPEPRLALRVRDTTALQHWQHHLHLEGARIGIAGVDDDDLLLTGTSARTAVSLRAPLSAPTRSWHSATVAGTLLRLLRLGAQLPVDYITVQPLPIDGRAVVLIAVPHRDDVLQWQQLLPTYAVSTNTWDEASDSTVEAPLTYVATGAPFPGVPVIAYCTHTPDDLDLEAMWSAP